MKKTSQKTGFKKLTLSNLSNEALEALKGGSSYVTYNCPAGTSDCPLVSDLCTIRCGGSLRTCQIP
jgi:hypothetical protein